MDDPINIEAIKALCAAVTPGLWEWDSGIEPWQRYRLTSASLLAEVITVGWDGEGNESMTVAPADMSFIARSRTLVPALVAEVDRIRAELSARDLALAMARGDRWPPGWAWSEQDEGFRSPNNDAYIRVTCINHLGPDGMAGAPIGWRLYRRDEKIRGMSISDKVVYPDALAALRAYPAGVQS